MQKNIIGVLLLLAVGMAAFAQKNTFQAGHWITSEGEQVDGFIAPQILSDGKIKAKAATRTAATQRLHPQDVQQIVVAEKPLFYSESFDRAGNTTHFFVKALLWGEISLYRGDVADYGKAFFVQQPSGDFLLINKNVPEKFLTTLYPNCTEMLEQKSIRYTTKSLLEATQRLNACKFPETEPIVQADGQGLNPTFALGGRVVLNTGSMVFNERELENFPRDFSATISGMLLANWSFPKGFLIQIGLSYIEKETMGEIPRSLFTSYDMDARFTYLEVPFSIGYRVTLGPVEPYAAVGMNIATQLSAEWDERDADFNNLNIGPFGELGILVKVGAKSKLVGSATLLRTETDYKYFLDSGQSQSVDLITDRLMLGLGFLQAF